MPKTDALQRLNFVPNSEHSRGTVIFGKKVELLVFLFFYRNAGRNVAKTGIFNYNLKRNFKFGFYRN